METVHLSIDGQIIIPESIRKALQWETERELIAVNTGEGILLKAKNPFPKTTLADVAGCLLYRGEVKTLEQMEEEIWNDRDNISRRSI